MRLPAPATLALALALPLAGCLAGPVPDPGPGGPGPAAAGGAGEVLPWGLEECLFVIGLVRFDPAQARDLLPEGFSFRTGDGLPLPVEVGPLDAATLGVEAFACDSGAGLAGPVAPLAYGSLYFNVAPPPELSAGDDAGHFYKLSVLIPDADRRAALEAAGADVTGGGVALAQGPASTSGTMALDTVGAVSLAAVHLQANPGFEGFRFREFTPAADGRLVQWDAVARSPGTFNGRGTLEVPAGSLAARLGGGTSLQVAMFGGTYTFEDGTITLPRRG